MGDQVSALVKDGYKAGNVPGGHGDLFLQGGFS
jgi:hypothetical protein